MKTVNMLFLEALRASLEKSTVAWETELTPVQWQELFAVAAAHHVLPMIYEAVAHSSAAKKADPQMIMTVRQQTMQTVMMQTVKTDGFLNLLQNLVSAGVAPLVVKGIICRELYPNPDCRISADEDLLVSEKQFPLCHETMIACGMEPLSQDLEKHEISYSRKASQLHIEVHKQLFSPESDAYDEFNHFFETAHEHAITKNILGVQVMTLDHTDHLFYLICHSFKHFLHSGFGIRQVCDICLYANAFGSEIDWLRILKQCKEIQADLFAAALFRIGEKYLTFRPDVACFPGQWRTLTVDETAMLEDLLDSGVFGGSSMSRRHSSNMTLHAVSSRKQGGKGGNSVLRTVFPAAKDLAGRYPYLERKPYLLPVAWADRIIKYRGETKAGNPGNNATESVKIGKRRIELLKQYGIIER